MRRFLLLHVGYRQPTPEIMADWERWFASIADNTVEQGGFSQGREVSQSGTKDLPWDLEALTGYNIIEAEDLDAAEEIAQRNPYITSIRVYEIRSM